MKTIISYFILEALEDEFSLLVFIFSYSILCFELVVFHGLRVVEVHVFGVEHMSAEIEHCAFVDLCCLVLGGVDLGVELDEVTDPLYEITALFLHLEVFFLGEIGEAD